MSYDFYRETVRCACGFKCDYSVEWPPVPMIIVRFSEEDWTGEECPRCDEPLPVPDGLPEPGVYQGAATGDVLNALRERKVPR